MAETGDSDTSTEVVVNPQGRVTIPAQMRRNAGIEAGDTLVMYVEDGRVVLESRAQLAARLRHEIAASWQGPADLSAADELITDRRAETAAEDAGR